MQDADAETLAAYRLARSTGIGPAHFRTLLTRFGSAVRALAAVPKLVEAGRLSGVRLAPEAQIRDELAGSAALGATLLHRGDPAYPHQLAAIDGAPPLLAVRGAIALLARPAVAIVGSRNASAGGRRLARELGRDLARAGLVIVSGLARGIDTAAHEGALDAEGDTVAVVASGVDIAYPDENRPLLERIAAQGAIVSERPLAAVPRAKDFPRRNRIIAGLSLGVVIVEAAPRSGSLITARYAAEQGREVMAVPGSPADERHRGTNQLLKDGAQLIESAADVLAAVEPLMQRGFAQAAARPARPAAPAPRPGPAAAPPPAAHPPHGLEARILEALGPTPLAVDELVRECDASAAAVQDALLDLELAGRVERHPGNRVSLRTG